MAQKTQVFLIDDLDGRDAHQTVSFGLEGIDYEIDLSNMHGDEMRAALAKFLERARPVKRANGRGAAHHARRADRILGAAIDTNAVRAWAKAQGIAVKDRGRVPADLVEQYKRRDSVIPVPPILAQAVANAAAEPVAPEAVFQPPEEAAVEAAPDLIAEAEATPVKMRAPTRKRAPRATAAKA